MTVPATYANTAIGDRVIVTWGKRLAVGLRYHPDTIIRKHTKGTPDLVIHCGSSGDDLSVAELPFDANRIYGLHEISEPTALRTDAFGTYATHVVSNPSFPYSTMYQTYHFKNYIDCNECESNYERALKGEGYVPHYYSQMCRRAVKRPHCTCDLCF